MARFRYPLVLFIASFVFLLIGMIMKIQRWPGGNLITGSMLMVQLFSIVWFVILLLKPDK